MPSRWRSDRGETIKRAAPSVPICEIGQQHRLESERTLHRSVLGSVSGRNVAKHREEEECGSSTAIIHFTVEGIYP
jgi:hypothetical protein